MYMQTYNILSFSHLNILKKILLLWKKVGHMGLEHNVNKWQNFQFLYELFH